MNKHIVPILGFITVLLCAGVMIWIQVTLAIPVTNRSQVDKNGNRDVVQYVIDMDNFSFTPSFMRADPGKDFKIQLNSKNGSHRLIIDGLNYDSGIISEGQTKIVTISIPANAKGEYEFHCGVGNHKDMGMMGKLQIDTK